MASLKAEKPVGTQLFGQVKKEPAKISTSAAPKAPASKPASKPAAKKAASKPLEPKKKVTKGGKSTAKP